MKKLIRIIAISLAGLLLLMILIPILFKSRIEAVVKQKINENVEATVDWDRFSMSLFRGFPDLSINLHGLSVSGLGAFEGDTLLALHRFELRANPFSVIKRNVQVKALILDRPLINAKVLKDSTANWDIAKDAGEAEVEADDGGEGTSMGLSLNRFAIIDGRIFYEDLSSGMKAGMEELDLELSGDFSMSETEVRAELDVLGADVVMGGIPYLRKGHIGLDLLAAANLETQHYAMLENEIRINGLVLGIEGSVDMPENKGMILDLDFFTKQTSFQTLLSLVPSIYLQDFESLETRGELKLEGSIEGVMKDNLMPDATLQLAVIDGFFAYPDLPKNVSDVQILLNAAYNGADMDLSTLSLERFHLSLGGNPFDIRLEVDHPVSDMHVAGAMKGLVDFSTLKDVVPMEDVELEGQLRADLTVDTRMSYIEEERYEEVDLDGMLRIEGVEVESGDLPVPVLLEEMHMLFNPRHVALESLKMTLGGSDLQMKGELRNFIPYVFADGTVSGSLAVSSALMDANELMPAPDTTTSAMEEQQVEEALPADSLSEEVGMKIPEDIDFRLDLDLKEVRYEEILVENIRGIMRVSQGVAYLEGLDMEVIDGQVNASGKVDTRGELPEADLNLDLSNVDIPRAYETFVTVEKLAPMAQYCMGSANIKMKLSTTLDAGFNPLYESIHADGRVFTNDVKVYNTSSFVKLSQLLKNEKFREMAPDDMNIKFRIREGRVIVDPFDMKIDNSKMRIGGSHGIDMTLDYLLDMDLATEDMGSAAQDLMGSVSLLAAGAGIKLKQPEFIKVKAKISGTFKDPKISLDMGGNMQDGGETAKEAVEQKVMEEVEKKEEELREEGREKADEILKEAQEQVDMIMKEARKAGEELVKEAEKQGANLVKEAGSNPLKKFAAEEASKELVRQAEKQSGLMLQEAREEADQIMAEARAQAEKI